MEKKGLTIKIIIKQHLNKYFNYLKINSAFDYFKYQIII